jgi:hypothetical protein
MRNQVKICTVNFDMFGRKGLLATSEIISYDFLGGAEKYHDNYRAHDAWSI